jgi:hypothetical protein
LKTAKKYDVAWRHGAAISDTFCVYLKKTPIQISNILDEAENMFKSIVPFKYMIYKGFLRGGNS